MRIGVGLVDFAIAFVMLMVLMISFGDACSWTILLTPAIFLLLAILAGGVVARNDRWSASSASASVTASSTGRFHCSALALAC